MPAVMVAGLAGSLFAKLLWLFLAATVTSGIGAGLLFSGGLGEISGLADPDTMSPIQAEGAEAEP